MNTQANKRLEDHLGELPIFPLPQTVLFPYTTLPLHIFEPRYRQMVRDARDYELPIGMALLIPDGGTDDAGRPRVEPVAGVGFIESLEELEDGRFLVELRGVARVKIVEEHPPEKLYRRVRATLLNDDRSATDAIKDHIQTLELLVVSMRQVNPRVAEYLNMMIAEIEDPAAVADSVASVIFPEADKRQQLLCELDVEVRLKEVVARMSELLAMATIPDDDTKFN